MRISFGVPRSLRFCKGRVLCLTRAGAAPLTGGRKNSQFGNQFRSPSLFFLLS
jgi:hypothetical protein